MDAEPLYECPFCGTLKTSPNGTGSDVSCCGEVGHAQLVQEVATPIEVTIANVIESRRTA